MAYLVSLLEALGLLERKAGQMATGPRPKSKTFNKMVPVVISGTVVVPPAPKHFTVPMAALWTTIWQGGGGFYQPSDALSIARYVEITERRRKLVDMYEEEGIMVVGSMGQPVAHPALKLAAESEVLIGRLECLLGLNPSDRVRLGIAALEQQSALEAFFQKKQSVLSDAGSTEIIDVEPTE